MTCKDCYHCSVCCGHDEEKANREYPPSERCRDFKDKSRIVELPVSVGDSFYTIQRYCNTDPYETEKEPVMAWDCEKYCGRGDCSFSEYRIEEHKFGTVDFILKVEKDLGKKVFLTREEAEEALRKERSNGMD